MWTVFLCLEFSQLQYEILKCIRYLTALWVLAVIAWVDYSSVTIPNKILAALMEIRSVILVVECLVCKEYWMTSILAAAAGLLLGGGIIFWCYLVTGGGIGAGDVKLFAVLGFCFGSRAILAVIVLSVMTAALFCVLGLAFGKISLKQEMPFAPFALAGTVLMMIFAV